jgi:hypothetical protein
MSQPRVRQALKAHPDGLTADELRGVVGATKQNVLSMVKAMPDVYIDHWRPNKKKSPPFLAVYALADIPEDAPMPDVVRT